MVPVVVRLDRPGVCGCGAVVAAGERAGATRHPGRIVCLPCLAAFSAKPEDESQIETREDEPVNEAPHDVSPQELRAPAAVLIPADWASCDPITLPGWQRSAGVAVALPPAAAPAPSSAPDPSSAPTSGPASVAEVPVATPVAEDAATPAGVPVAVPVAEDVATPVAEPGPRHTQPVVPAATPTATPSAPVAAVVVEVTTEAVAMTVPSHRRRTLLPAGLLALKSSRGREPGSTGQSDAATRAVLDAAAGSGVLSLHDRRMPGRRARIAHLAFGGGGVYVIDVVRAKNASVEVRPVDELDPDPQELWVGGRVMTKPVAAAQDRVAIVRALLDDVELSTVPTVGVICLVDAALSTDAPLEVDGVWVVGRTGLRTVVEADGTLDEEHRQTLHEYLTEHLPA